MLTLKEGKGGGLYPYQVPFAADLTDMSSSQALPAKATISDWFDGGSGYEHVHIEKNASAISVRINNGSQQEFVGTVGATYADLLKNVLTHFKGGYAGLHAELYCCEQCLAPSVFGQPSPVAPSVWVPKEVVVPVGFVGTLIPVNIGVVVSDMDDYSSYSGLFDGATTSLIGSHPNNKTAYGGKNWGASAYAIDSARVFSPGDGFLGTNNALMTHTLQGYTSATGWVSIGATTAMDANAYHSLVIESMDKTAKWTQTRLLLSHSSSYTNGLFYSEIELYEAREITYGGSGVHLDFALSADIGNDVSGNNNDWTVNGAQSNNTPTH